VPPALATEDTEVGAKSDKGFKAAKAKKDKGSKASFTSNKHGATEATPSQKSAIQLAREKFAAAKVFKNANASFKRKGTGANAGRVGV
jgi:nucleolar protein 9